VPQDVLIFLVDHKIPGLSKDSPEYIPSIVTISTPLGQIEVPTDVRILATGIYHAGAISPGFHCGVTAGSNVGTLGCITSGDPPYAIVSGHVAVKKGVPVTATSCTGSTVPLGTALEVCNDDSVDAALVGPIPPSSLGGITDSPTAIRDLDLSDTQLPIHISVTRSPGKLFASVEVVSEPAIFINPISGESNTMNALIRLDQPVTTHGDSGAPALDATGLLVGFVEGVADGRTYILPARRAIDGVSK
jgi:hypothetical protein